MTKRQAVGIIPCAVVILLRVMRMARTHRAGATLRFTGSASSKKFVAALRQAGPLYHSFYFDNGFAAQGDYDIGRDVAGYGFPDDLTALRVLDVGAASGWFSFYFEQLGATVTAVDVASTTDWDTFGPWVWPRPEETSGEYMGPFAVMARLLDSNVERVRARAYDLTPELFGGETFDLVFMGALLLHLHDPLGALMAARSVCRDRLIATNWFIPETAHAIVDLPALRQETGNVWWRPSRSAYALWLQAAGFRAIDVARTVPLSTDRVVPGRNARDQTLLVGDARI